MKNEEEIEGVIDGYMRDKDEDVAYEAQSNCHSITILNRHKLEEERGKSSTLNERVNKKINAGLDHLSPDETYIKGSTRTKKVH